MVYVVGVEVAVAIVVVDVGLVEQEGTLYSG